MVLAVLAPCLCGLPTVCSIVGCPKVVPDMDAVIWHPTGRGAGRLPLLSRSWGRKLIPFLVDDVNLAFNFYLDGNLGFNLEFRYLQRKTGRTGNNNKQSTNMPGLLTSYRFIQARPNSIQFNYFAIEILKLKLA